MSTAIITGVAGFIGCHIASALLRGGWTVAGIDNFDQFYPRSEKERNLSGLRARDAFQFQVADIRDGRAVADLMSDVRPHAIFHLAALAGVRPSILEPGRFVDVNVNGTAAVLEAARLCGCKNIVFASSSSVYGDNEKTPFAEDDPVDHPISPYAATKRAGELLCHAYSRLFDLRIACLRFFTVYGPAQRPDLAIMKFMRRIAAGEPVPMFGDGSSSRDYTYIDDIVEGVLAAHERIEQATDPFRIWNLGHSNPVRLRDLIDAIARIVGRPAIIESLPRQPGDVDRTWADISRSSRELGYEPKTCLESGLERQWRWLQTAG